VAIQQIENLRYVCERPSSLRWQCQDAPAASFTDKLCLTEPRHVLISFSPSPRLRRTGPPLQRLWWALQGLWGGPPLLKATADTRTFIVRVVLWHLNRMRDAGSGFWVPGSGLPSSIIHPPLWLQAQTSVSDCVALCRIIPDHVGAQTTWSPLAWWRWALSRFVKA